MSAESGVGGVTATTMVRLRDLGKWSGGNTPSKSNAAYWTDGGNGQRAWFLADLDGDGRLDLVHTADPTRTGLYVFTDAQGAYWKVYRGL